MDEKMKIYNEIIQEVLNDWGEHIEMLKDGQEKDKWIKYALAVEIFNLRGKINAMKQFDKKLSKFF